VPLDPLIPHSREDQRIRGLDAGIEQARVAIERELYISRMEVSNLLNQLSGIEQTLKARELAERRAQEVYTQTLAAYEKGGRELLDVQDAQASLQEARLSILNEKYNYIAALADLEFAVGRRIFKE
jgi:outer membrane protein TolC